MRRVENAVTIKTVARAKLIYGLIALIWMISAGSSSALAGWRIDAHRFLQSAHAENACSDCHSDIEALPRHPDPGNVNKTMGDFFAPEKCLDCHDDVQGQIEDDAEHGGEEVQDVQRFLNCIDCHNPHYEGAPEEVVASDPVLFSEENEACMACHQAIQSQQADAAALTRNLCFACHTVGKGMPAAVPVMDPAQYAQTPHADLDCLTCHLQADQYAHNRQGLGDCAQCHQPHQESVAHEAHSGVACQACHLEDVAPMRDAQTHAVVWERGALPSTVTRLHNLSKPDGQGCARCHFDGNPVGAAALILPPKSVLCMPCHAATLTAGDKISMASLAVFAFGMLAFMALWFSGSFAGAQGGGVIGNALRAVGGGLGAVFSARIGTILKAVWFDVILQRRLYQRSARRWAIHALIFWPFMIRFIWGISALFSTNWLKGWPLAWELINKNHPVTALVFDLTGLCLVVGIVLSLVRGSEADKSRTQGLPSQDRIALALIGGIALVGFLLEGMRIAMTGAQGPAAYAFIGYGISRLFVTMQSLSVAYGYIWYLHALLTGAFVAYLPFSRMLHIIMSPVVLAMNAVQKKEHH